MQEARRYTDLDDTDNESEGPTPSAQGIFGLFKGSTPQNDKQHGGGSMAKRLKVSGFYRRVCVVKTFYRTCALRRGKKLKGRESDRWGGGHVHRSVLVTLLCIHLS
jgi:hypothetical protein